MWSEPPVVLAENLSKTYLVFARPLDRLKQALLGGKRHYGRAFHALSDVSFSLRRGQVLGLIGNNGAGKSTLLQLICQTLKPSSGKLQVIGRVAALLELGAGFNPEFTGRENIFLNAAVLGLSHDEITQRYDSIVEFSGVGDFIDQPVKTYSSGMYIRLAFSIATSVDPDILIIDEALSVGDGAFARKSFDRIMALKNGGATILFCSHSMYHIEAICDQAIWLERGSVVMQGTPHEVTKAYTAQAFAPPDSPAKIEPLTNSITPVLPQGQGRLLKVSVSADGVTSRELRLKAGVSELCVSTQFEFDPALPVPTIAFCIDTDAGANVSSGSTLFDSVQPKLLAPSKGEVTLRFPKVNLMRGRYRLTIFLACEKTLHAYDQALYCAELEVVHGGVEQGVCFLPHAWNDGAVVTVPEELPLCQLADNV